MTTGAAALAAALEAEGVSWVFSVTGQSILPAVREFQIRGLPVVHARTEIGASFMAEGWGRVTGQPGCCLVTLGAAVTMTGNAAAGALLDGIPMVILAGRTACSAWDKDSFGDFDTLSVMKPVTKFARTVVSPDRVGEYVRLAFFHARNGRPGPVYLEFPYDVLIGPAPTWNGAPFAVGRSSAKHEAIAEAARTFSASKRPVVIVGNGLWIGGEHGRVRELLGDLRAPLLGARLGVGLLEVGGRNEGLASVGTNPVARRLLAEADVVLLLGTRLEFDLEWGVQQYFPNCGAFIQMDVGPVVPSEKSYQLVGDPALTLESFVKLLAGFERRSVAEPVAQLPEISECSDKDGPVHPRRLFEILQTVLPADASVALGGGETWSWGRNVLRIGWPGLLLQAPHRTGTLGSELPHAIATKLARPDRVSVVVTGDGSFGYTAFELETARRLGAPVICIIANNSGWAMEQWSQRLAFGPEAEYTTSLSCCRYELVADGLGVRGLLAQNESELVSALRQAISASDSCVIDVRTTDDFGPDTRWWFVETGRGNAM